MSRVAAMLGDLYKYLGLDEPGETETGFTLEIDGIPLHLSRDDRSSAEELVIYSPLGTVPEARELVAYRVFLEANLFWSATGDATLGVNSDTREAFLAYRLADLAVEPEGLLKVLGLFLEIAAGWRGYVAQLGNKGDEAVRPDVHGCLLRV